MKKIIAIIALCFVLATPSLAETPTMPDSMEELWEMYLDLLEKYNDLLEKYEEITENETASESETEESLFDFSDYANIGSEVDAAVILQYGQLISVIHGTKGTVVVKAKIGAQINNELTIRQNYYNVMDLIQNQGFDAYNEIQYWAVADTTTGQEVKVISFTINKESIDIIKKGWTTARSLDIYLDDLWILPGLRQ